MQPIERRTHLGGVTRLMPRIRDAWPFDQP